MSGERYGQGFPGPRSKTFVLDNARARLRIDREANNGACTLTIGGSAGDFVSARLSPDEALELMREICGPEFCKWHPSTSIGGSFCSDCGPFRPDPEVSP